MNKIIRRITDEERKSAKGRCYPRAWRFIQNKPRDKQGQYLLVHGYIAGLVGYIKGVQIDHAWVEKGDLVIDPSINPRKPRRMSKSEYYSKWSVDESLVKRYTLFEAQELGFKAGGNFGPWD